MHPELPVASFVCAILVLLPLPWHWRAGTVPTISISLWLFLCNFINGVNTIIWSGNVRVVAPVWCDIVTKILLGANVALPASIFCLCIHLERISSVRQAETSLRQKRTRQIIDSIVCLPVPLVYMALHYIVQGHRFDIVEDFGCRAAVYVSVPAVIIVWVPQLFFSVGSLILSALAFRNFWARRITFARHLQQSNSGLTASRYFKLMAMSVVQMFWVVTITSVSMAFSMKFGVKPYTSWDDVHYGFSKIGLFPTWVIPKYHVIMSHLLWWMCTPVSSILFVAFFAFGEDAVKEYRAVYNGIRKHIFRRPDSGTLLTYKSETKSK
ncbi:fungal pheromone STE3G-protein-coupled receptor [Coprinopsis marcescibilis]|uniref:Fungal pheromone STE3G-protein-coupled receptor n=1 Tax=Coprinopsis marcescibilis TaxID=230819 RepID=A0A5C3KGM1_COPMA|nr:fungal pheromone STE3G-protein-coupled receptor [Coprinopsis marcescibilis]